MAETGSQLGGLAKVGVVLAILIIGVNFYIGSTIQEIGIPGLFTVKFKSREESPALPVAQEGNNESSPEEKNVHGENSVNNPEEVVVQHTEENISPTVRTYLMDNQPGRIVVISHVKDNTYRIEEASSPWPWEGRVEIDGTQLVGEAKFKKSQASMRLTGVVREDKAIEIEYRFITGSDGKPSAGRVDDHVLYYSH